MRANLSLLFILLTVFVGFNTAAYGDTRYVSDMLILTVRETPDTDAVVLGNLKTADSLEVLEESGRYLKVRAKNGLEGWVQKNYITKEKPKALIIQDLNNQIKQLNAKIQELGENHGVFEDKMEQIRQKDQLKNKTLEDNISALNDQLKQLTEKYNTLLEGSKQNVAALTSEREELKATNANLTDEIDKLKAKSANLPESKRTRFFLTGAGVLLVGYFLGKSATRKKY